MSLKFLVFPSQEEKKKKYAERRKNCLKMAKKSISARFWVQAAHKSWLKYTTQRKCLFKHFVRAVFLSISDF